MKYDFDELIDRRGTGSVRWDTVVEKFGDPEVLPLTTADMDFRTAEPIRRAIRQAADFGVFGYTRPRDSYYEAVMDRLREKWGWEIRREWMEYSAGIVGAIAFCIQAMTRPGDGVALLTPVYHPFSHMIEDNGRVVRGCRLKEEEGRFSIDFSVLEAVLAREDVKLLIFCNPHNPAGRAWTKEELERVCALCVRYRVILLSDEIHSDFVYTGHTFRSAGPIMEAAGGAELLVVCTSASKSFNLAGLQTSTVIIPDRELRARYHGILMKQHFMELNLVGPVATEAAYRDCGDWQEQLLSYLEANRDYVVRFVREKLPGICPVEPEATYMMLLDCRGLGMSEAELEEFLIRRAKVSLNMGSTFGPGGEGFVRINFATPRALLTQALERIASALAERR